MNKTVYRIKLIAIYCGCLCLFLAAIPLIRYEDPPGLLFVSLVNMIAFPAGCIFILVSLGTAAWVTMQHLNRP